MDSIEAAIADIRAGQDGRRPRRRGPRERGRPRDGRADGDARGDQLHAQGSRRPDLRADARPSVSTSCRFRRWSPTTPRARNGVHRVGRSARTHRRPASPRTTARDRSKRCSIPSAAARFPASGTHVSAARARRRRARARRADRSLGRSRAARGTLSGRRDLRDHGRRRNDGAPRRTSSVFCRQSRPQAHHRQGPHRPPHAHEKLVKRIAEFDSADDQRNCSAASRIETTIDKTTHVALVMGEIGDGKDLLVRVHSRVPHRRRAALHSLRLRGAARRRDGRDRARRTRRVSVPASRRPRHRPGQQAARLRTAGPRRRHRRGEPRARACPSTSATTVSARRSSSTWACARCA